jgi:hypothetical protein
MSTPAAGRPITNSNDVSKSGSPAIIYDTKAFLPSDFNLAKV